MSLRHDIKYSWAPYERDYDYDFFGKHVFYPPKVTLGAYTMKEWKDMNKSLKDCTTEEIRAELKKREERDQHMKDMTWQKVMNVTNDQWPGGMTFHRIAKAAAMLGYKYFVVKGYQNVYAVGEPMWSEPGFHFKSLPIDKSEIR